MARTTPVNAGYTLINGTGTGINGGRIDVWAEYLIGQPDVSGNCTGITVYFYTALNPAYSSSTRNTRGLDSALQVGDAQAVGIKDGAYDFTSAQNIHLLGSYSGNVPHNADGTGSVRISGSFTTVSSYISGGSVSALVELPPIARETTLGATDAAIGQTSVIALSVKNPEYSHSLAFAFGELTGFITANGQISSQEVIFTAMGVPFAVPQDFYAQIPDSPTGVCTLTCRTYHGGVLIGQPQTAVFTVQALENLCRPFVGTRVEDINPVTLALTGNAKRLVRHASIARCYANALAQNASYITQILADGLIVEDSFVDIPVALQTEIPVVATDSRGFTGRNSDKSLVFVDYTPLSNLASVSRDEPTANTATLVFSGSYWNGNFGAADNSLLLEYKIGQGQWITAQPEITLSEGRYRASIQLTGLDYTQTHTLQVRVSDALSVAEKTLTVQKGIPVFDWGEEDFVFHVSVSAPQLSSPELTQLMERLNALEEKINGNN